MKDCGSCKHFIKLKGDRFGGGLCALLDGRVKTDSGAKCAHWKSKKYKRDNPKLCCSSRSEGRATVNCYILVADMDRALIVRKPWIDLILSGQKAWEMRSRSTNIRGKIGLIEQGTGLIVGECVLQGVGESIKNFNIGYGYQLHKIGDVELLDKWHIPWILSEAKRYAKPIPYSHPKGAVTWVKI